MYQTSTDIRALADRDEDEVVLCGKQIRGTGVEKVILTEAINCGNRVHSAPN